MEMGSGCQLRQQLCRPIYQDQIAEERRKMAQRITNINYMYHEQYVPRYNVMLPRNPSLWCGQLVLKNNRLNVQLHHLSGDVKIVHDSLPRNIYPNVPSIQIDYTSDLDPNRLQKLAQDICCGQQNCILIGLPFGHSVQNVMNQIQCLRHVFIEYLANNKRAGITLIKVEDRPEKIIYFFAASQLIVQSLGISSPQLIHSLRNAAYLIVVIIRLNPTINLEFKKST